MKEPHEAKSENPVSFNLNYNYNVLRRLRWRVEKREKDQKSQKKSSQFD